MHNLLAGIFVIALLLPVGLGLFANGVTADKICGSNGSSQTLLSDNFENGLTQWVDYGTANPPSNTILTTSTSFSPTHSLEAVNVNSTNDIWNNVDFSLPATSTISWYAQNDLSAPNTNDMWFVTPQNSDENYNNAIFVVGRHNATGDFVLFQTVTNGVSSNDLSLSTTQGWQQYTLTISSTSVKLSVGSQSLTISGTFTQPLNKIELITRHFISFNGHIDNVLVGGSGGSGRNPHCVEALNVALLTPLIAVGGIIVLLIKRYNDN